jgi:hypothetical protein
MGKMDQLAHFEIEMDNERTCFIPGQRVEGIVSLILNEPAQVFRIRIRFYGKTITNLHKNPGIMNESSTVTMFKDYSYLLGERDSEPIVLDEGEHVYPYQFRLPGSSLPASFEGDYGGVRYWLEALIDTEHGRRTVYKYLTIPSSKNVRDPEYDISPVIVKKGRVGLGLWKKEEYHVKVSTERLAYTSGIYSLTKNNMLPYQSVSQIIRPLVSLSRAFASSKRLDIRLLTGFYSLKIGVEGLEQKRFTF